MKRRLKYTLDIEHNVNQTMFAANLNGSTVYWGREPSQLRERITADTVLMRLEKKNPTA